MRTRYFALIFGLIYLVIGILGFVPRLLVPPPGGGPAVSVTSYYGLLLGVFPVNALHNVVHLVLGLWGIAAWRAFGSARIYARSLAIIFAVLTVLGLIPVTNTLFGMAPMYSYDIWLHAITAVISAYFGWAAVPATTTVQSGAGFRR